MDNKQNEPYDAKIMTIPRKDNLRIMEGLLSWGIEQQTKTTIQPYNQNNDNKKRQPVNYGRFAQLGKNGMLRLPCAPQSSDNGREFS